LLVDDDDFIRDLLNIVFSNKGCFLRTVETAEEGLCALKEEKFDIIISDLRLPVMDGLEFLKSAIATQPEAVKVLVTAYGDKDVVSKVSCIGVHAYMENLFRLKHSLSRSLC
jgi:DNA-binding NtrC family response regulator